MAANPTPAATPLEDADRAALAALLELALSQTQAVAAWWECADRSGVLLATEHSPSTADAQRHDAAIEGRVLARLALLHPRQPEPQALAALLCAAAALLHAREQARSARLEAERLSDAGRTASDWLWETDADGKMVWMTESIAVLTGATSVDRPGSAVLDNNRVRTDEYAASYEKYRADRAARRPIRGLVLDRVTPDGIITVSINGEPRFGPSGEFLGYRGATRNITAELQARAEVRKAQELLQQTIEGMPASVMISGADDRILMANARWREGIGRDLPAGCDTWSGVIRHHARVGNYPAAVGREDDYVAWRLAQASEQPAPIELQWRDEWVLAADRRLPDGSVVHLSIFVTARKQAELALAHAEDRWRFALDGAGHGVWDWDHDTGMYYSPSWKAMLGFADDEISNRRREWIDRVHPDDRAAFEVEFNRHLRGEAAIYESEYRLRRKDGQYLWIHDRGRAIRRDADGTPLRMVGTHSDITRLRLADQALRDKQAAELVSRSTSEFLSRMSHEMRTPLNAVIGFAELLHMGGEYRADKVEHILAAGRHLLELINDVLDLQQVAQGAFALRSGAVDVAALAHDVQALLRPQALKLGVAARVKDLAGVFVQADEQRLRQVMLNLGSNAIKYNQRGGWWCWRVEASDPQRWGLVIEDSGPGLDEAQLARLFRPFERLGRENSAIEGSGLGLVIARRLVEAMSGELVVRSAPGQGTSVTVWLPRADAAPRAPANAAVPTDTGAETPAGVARQVLYVEDNPLNALLFTESLRRHPELNVRVAVDCEEALAIAGSWRPDLLVIDMHLPGCTGTEVLQRMRLLPGFDAVPAVVCSADAMPEDRVRALAEGFCDYWTKPLDLRRLAEKIESAIAQPARP